MGEVGIIDLNERQKEILEIVKSSGPISGEEIASRLRVSRAALRPYLAVLTMSGLLDGRPRVGYSYSGKRTPGLLQDFLKNLTVNDVKSIPVMVRDKTSVYDAIVTLFVEDVGTLFVVNEEGYLQGVVSRKDLLKAAIGTPDLSRVPVAVIMTRMPNVFTVDPEDDIFLIAKKIMDYQVDALPVVREVSPGNLKVIGKVSKTTLVRLLAEANS